MSKDNCILAFDLPIFYVYDLLVFKFDDAVSYKSILFLEYYVGLSCLTDCRHTCIPEYVYVFIAFQNITFMHTYILTWCSTELKIENLNGVVARKAWEPLH